VTTLLFAVIFKVLPDATIKWKDIWPGAIATSLLFLVGKFAISFYISKSEVGSTYGAAGSLVVLLLWVFYSAIILYFGAEFTKAYAIKRGARIIPNKYAKWDHEETVPGAKPKNLQEETAAAFHYPQPAATPRTATASPFPFVHPVTQPRKPGGMGTVLVGLLIYLLRSPGKDQKNRDDA
jgi:membrane protein